jgi:D-alanine-D-alanine ligase
VLSKPKEALGSVPAPWIVKPVREDASHGIAAASVVADRKAMQARVAYVLERYKQPALVEEYVDGREFNVSILGTGEGARALPLAEIDFSRLPPGAPRVLTYEGKWDEASPEYRGTMPKPVDEADPGLLEAVRRTALLAYRALGLRDYGRVDLRVDAKRGPLVIDVNPNPDVSPGAGLALAAARGGLSHARLVAEILEAAAARGAAP